MMSFITKILCRILGHRFVGRDGAMFIGQCDGLTFLTCTRGDCIARAEIGR